MKQKIFTLFLALAASVGTIFAEKVKIGKLYYNLDATNKTAEVTSQNSDYPYWSATIATANIPSSVDYESVTYSVTSIGEYAFYNCSGLTSVTIPNSVTSIGSGAFAYCSGLTSISVDASNQNYCDIDGVLFNKEQTTLIQYPAGKSSTEYFIPNSVTEIGEYAFLSCTGLTSVTIPNSVTSIGNYAFEGCTGLTSVTIPNSVTEISNYAFAYCTSLTSVALNSDAIVGKNYSNGSNIGSIFGKQVVEYIIGDDVTSIGNGAFSECTGLTSITIGNSVTEIGKEAFYGCKSLTSVTIGNSVTKIGKSAFYGCTGLTSVTIPNSVTEISNDAFTYCTSLTFVTIPNSVTEISNDAFLSCTGLTSVTIPNSVTSIGNYAFEGCTDLTSVTIPNSVTSIGDWAFSGCTNLPVIDNLRYADTYLVGAVDKTLSTYTIKDGTKWIGTSAFEGCKSLTSVTIPNSVTSIGDRAFSECTGLTSVTIPNSVTSIGHLAFFECSGLTSVTIGNSVTSIGERAFYECSGLTSIEIPNSVTSIGSYAFVGCSSLTSVTIPNSVTSIGGSAFSGCTGLTSVTIGNSVTKIGNSAFYGCTGLTSITIPNSVTSIGDWAFSGCTNLPVIDNLRYADTYLVGAVDKTLSTYTIKDGTKWIGTSAFEGCKSLTSVTIPNSVTEIGYEAFYGCTGLTSVTLPNSVTRIGNDAFNGCSGLTSITIPNSVTSIGGSAFSGCSGLTSIEIPNSVTSIGDYAFRDCSGLTSVTCEASTPPACRSDVFDGVDKSIPLYVPAESVEAYKAAAQWEDFGDNIKPIQAAEADVTEIEAEPTDNSVVIEWPKVDEATVYTIEIKKNGELICTLTFNGLGQLQNIAFAKPARNGGRDSQVRTAIQTTNGWKYTIGGLEANTEYTFNVTAKKSDNSMVYTQTIPFTTKNAPTSEEETTYSVIFYDWNGDVLDTQTIGVGNDAVAPANPTRDGYTFIGWDKEFTNVQSDLAVTAQYEQDTPGTTYYTLTISASAGGSVNETVNGSYEEGTSVTIIATPDAGYVFDQWSDGDKNATRTITINSNITLSASFKEQSVGVQYTLTISAGVGGSVNETVNGTYDEGANVTIIATPDAGYVFDQWSDGDKNATRVITMNEDKTLTATFLSDTKYNVKITVVKADDADELYGKVKVNDGSEKTKFEDQVLGGTKLTVEAVPEDGYTLNEWSDDEDEKSLVREIEIKSDTTIKVSFRELKKFTLTVNISPAKAGKVEMNGEVREDNQLKVTEGMSITVKAIPAEGFKFKGWEDASGEIFETTAETSIKMAKSREITAVFEAAQGFENIEAEGAPAQKMIINGQLFIFRNGEMYNAQGAKVE